MIPLINIKDVQDQLDLSLNVEESKYNQFIIAAQIKDLTYLIGEGCVQEIEDAVCTNTLDEYQEPLMELIKPYLVNWSYAHYVKQSMLQSTQSGIVKTEGDNSSNISDTEKKQASEFYSTVGIAWGKKIIRLLESDKDNYVCYHSEHCDCCQKETLGRSIFNL
mgnify:CR=1 FL=1|jgi:hypothetical protein